MKAIIVGLALVSFLGCASAEQKIASKQDYRDSQVEAIKIQAEQRTARQTSEQLAEAAMWQSLAEAVKANPESASHFAIVMAVAASKGGDSDAGTEMPMTTIKTERDVTALDWAKVLTAPVLGTVTQVGIAALNTDLQKEISRNNTAVNIVEAEIEGKIYDAVGVMASTPRTTVTVSDSASYVGGDSSVSTTTSTETNTTTSTTTTTTTDDDIYVVGIDVAEADGLIDDIVGETESFGVEDEVVDDTTEGVDDGGETTDDSTDDGTEPYDCSEPQFSPMPPECQT